MQPATDRTEGPSPLRRWGPIAGIVAVVAVVVGLVVTGGGDDDGDTPPGDGTTAPSSDVAAGEGAVSFSDAAEQGLDIDFGDRCDVETGKLAIPDYGAAECFAPFDGDNGGATDTGVTEDAIKIVVYQGPDSDPVLDFINDAILVDDTNADAQDSIQKWVAMLQRYHETYGRTVEVEFYVSQGLSTDATTARADAVKIAEDIRPFQVWGGPVLTEAFGEELAARGVQCIGCAGGTQGEMADRAPYVIGTALTTEQSRAHNVEALVKQVAGRNAVHAGDPSMHDRERVFGYVHIESDENSARDAQAYVDALAERGVEIAERVPYALDPTTLQETADNAIAKLKQAGVTTVIFAGDPVAPREFTRAATAQEFRPEWFVNLSALVDTNAFARTYDQEQWAHAFGLSALWARVDPQVSGSQFLYNWFYGEEPAADGSINVLTGNPTLFFRTLQQVGPNLTHETFIQTLFDAAPTEQRLTASSLSFGDHGRWPMLDGLDYMGIDDVTKIWWDPVTEVEDERREFGAGVWHFVDGGARYLAAEWPEGEFRAFEDAGSSTIYDVAPEAERTPDYEPLSLDG